MVKKKHPDPDTTQTIGFQVAMAFGQGAGTMLATPAALRHAFSKYDAIFTRNVKRWPEYELVALEYARALGQQAAFAAARDNRCVIDVDDVQHGLDVIWRNRLRPLSNCGLTPLRQRQPLSEPE